MNLTPKTASFKCPKCGGVSGWIGPCDACVAAFEQRDQESKLDAALRAMIEVGALPEYFPLHYRFKDSRPDIEAANKIHWAWLRSWPRERNLYIWGPTGTGKTHACVATMIEYAARGRSLGMATAFDMVQAGMKLYDYKAGRSVSAWCNADIMLIDDVDKVRWDDRSLPVLQNILNSRSMFRAPMRVTMFTANVDPLGLKKLLLSVAPVDNLSYVGTILSRLNPCDKLEFVGQSWREKGE